MITGKIKQIETMGLLDGPGIRIIVFMQGCPLRCLFCHNPEMWDLNGGSVYTPEEIVDVIRKYRHYFSNGGGVTFSGGEPLTQPKFLIECLKLCQRYGINTCLDTSGVGDEKYYEEILKYTDLVIYDIKALDKDQYQKITGLPIDRSLSFLDICEKLNKNIWIRSVIVPGINDNDEYVYTLGSFIQKRKNISKVELLSYHKMAISKYRELGIKYPLEEVTAMNVDKCKKLEKKLQQMLYMF